MYSRQIAQIAIRQYLQAGCRRFKSVSAQDYWSVCSEPSVLLWPMEMREGCLPGGRNDQRWGRCSRLLEASVVEGMGTLRRMCHGKRAGSSNRGPLEPCGNHAVIPRSVFKVLRDAEWILARCIGSNALDVRHVQPVLIPVANLTMPVWMLPVAESKKNDPTKAFRRSTGSATSDAFSPR